MVQISLHSIASTSHSSISTPNGTDQSEQHCKHKSGLQDAPIPGMDSVIATVTGYVGEERFNLIKLIHRTGGVYVGSLTKPTTHLVCRAFKGDKFELAKKLGTLIVNHCWFEHCLQARQRLPESPYTVLSGMLVGPLRWKQPSVIPALVTDLQNGCYQLRGKHAAELRKSKTRNDISNCIVLPCSTKTAEWDGPKEEIAGQEFTADLTGTERGYHGGINESDSRAAVCSFSVQVNSNAGNECCNDIGPSLLQEFSSRKNFSSVPMKYNEANLEDDKKACRNTTKKGNCMESVSLFMLNPSPSDGISDIEETDLFRTLRKGKSKGSLNFIGSSVHGVTVGKSSQQCLSKMGDSRKSKPRRLLKKRVNCDNLLIVSRHNGNLLQQQIQGMNGENAESSCVVGRNRVNVDVLSDDKHKRNHSVSEANSPTDGMESNDIQAEFCTPLLTTEELSQTLARKSLQSYHDGDIACVICHAETTAPAEGILSCGHHFCFLCIEQWASEAVSRSPCCPLCKAPFDWITKREWVNGVKNSGECSQSALIPYTEDVVMVGRNKILSSDHLPFEIDSSVCILCGSGDTEELLLRCQHCARRSAHTFCLDPPLPPVLDTPWYCGHCAQHRRAESRWWHDLHGVDL
eukprot:c20579_g1_i1 orf=362-2257(+)